MTWKVPPVPSVNVIVPGGSVHPLRQVPAMVGATGVGIGVLGLGFDGAMVGWNATTKSLMFLLVPPVSMNAVMSASNWQ